MARKTTALMDKLVKRHNEVTKHISSVLAAKSRGDENDPYSEYSSEYFLGLMEGHNQALEQALMDANCYHGFGYLDSLMRPITPASADFKEWRRVYYTK
jgi:hypothetical protein